MTSSRQAILDAIRAHRVPPVEPPGPDGPWTTYDDPQRQFAGMLESVGGRCVVAAGRDALNRDLAALPAYASARKVCSLVPGAGAPNVDLNAVADPHELEDVDFALLPGRFGVAENGAVWVNDSGLRHRVLPFLTQHLALVVPAGEIVHNMHEAYGRLPGAFDGAGFGVFISGPSKTADIEQSLVIGAHGPRSLTVYLLEGEINS